MRASTAPNFREPTPEEFDQDYRARLNALDDQWARGEISRQQYLAQTIELSEFRGYPRPVEPTKRERYAKRPKLGHPGIRRSRRFTHASGHEITDSERFKAAAVGKPCWRMTVNGRAVQAEMQKLTMEIVADADSRLAEMLRGLKPNTTYYIGPNREPFTTPPAEKDGE